MLRKESEAVPEGNGPVPRQEEFESDQPTLVDVYRLFEESFDIRLKIMKSRFGHQEKVERIHGNESNRTAFSKPRARCSAAMPCHGGRRAIRHQDLLAQGGRRCCSSSEAWG